MYSLLVEKPPLKSDRLSCAEGTSASVQGRLGVQAENPGVKHSLTRNPIASEHRQRGMTLIELMMGIVVTGALLAVGVPSFQSFIAASRITTTNNDFVSSMALARSEAIRRGSRITVCKSTNGTACVTTGDWAQGWIVFVDITRAPPNAAVDAGDTIVSRSPAAPAGLTIVGDTALANFVSFSADGTVRDMGGAAQQGRLRVCSTSAAVGDERRARDIALATTGRLTTTTPASVASNCPLT